MDIDKMFKRPAFPGGGGSKRKLPDQPSAEVLKRFRPDEPSDGPKTTRVTVEDEDESGPSYEPLPEAGDDGDDDDEGRFFGGGLDDEQNQILDIFDKAGDDLEAPEAMTVPALRRFLQRFERTIAKNAEQRGKYPDDPIKFIDSESDLDAAISQMFPLTQNPALYFPELVKSGAVVLLINLLSHENTDIAISVINLLGELTQEEIEVPDAGLDSEGSPESSNARLAQAQFIDELLSHSIFELLVSNVKRFNEAEQLDAEGVYHVMTVFDNLISFMPPLAQEIGSTKGLIEWLLKRVQAEEFDDNKAYASEILSMLLQNYRPNALNVIEKGGVEIVLTILAQYRNRDPQDADEEEFMENIFDSLYVIVGLPEGKQPFLSAEGVELMLILMKGRLFAGNRAIKVLDYAFQTDAGTPLCERFVEVLGLKTFFSAFMGKGDKKKKTSRRRKETYEDDEHLLSVLASLFTNLASDSPPRIRLIAKFVEGEYEKVDRLLELRDAAEGRLRATDRQIANERKVLNSNGEEIDDVQEDTWYLNRLDGGLSALQSADYVLAWICMEDDGIKAHAEVLLSRNNRSLSNAKDVLNEMSEHIEIDPDENPEDVDQDAAQRKMILEALVAFLSG